MNPLREKILHLIIMMHLLYCSTLWRQSGLSDAENLEEQKYEKKKKKKNSCWVGVVVLVTFGLLCLFLISHSQYFPVAGLLERSACVDAQLCSGNGGTSKGKEMFLSVPRGQWRQDLVQNGILLCVKTTPDEALSALNAGIIPTVFPVSAIMTFI